MSFIKSNPHRKTDYKPMMYICLVWIRNILYLNGYTDSYLGLFLIAQQHMITFKFACF